MSRADHPAERRRRMRVVAADNAHLIEWWEVERAQAQRERATTRLLHTAAWCIAALTAALVAVTLLDAIKGA